MRSLIRVNRGELSDYIRCMGLFELADYLNVEHQVSSVDILHHIIQTVLQKKNTDIHTLYT